MEKSILIVDDHDVVIRGLKMLIKTEFLKSYISECTNCDEAFERLEERKFDLAILDLKLKNTLSIHLIEHIVRNYPNIKILVVTTYPEKIFALRLYDIGIKGYVNKSAPVEVIIQAIHSLMQGKVFYSERTKELLLTNLGKPIDNHKFGKLSNKEMQVLFFLIRGKNLKDIEVLLDITKSTASTFKRRIYAKLKVTNLAELIELCSTYELH